MKKQLIWGTVTGITGNIGYAIINSLVNNGTKTDVSFNQIISFPIPLWIVILFLILASFVMWLINKLNKSESLPFLRRTSQIEQGVEFQWIWVKNKKTGKYEMKDFWPICPQCGKQMRMELYDPLHTYHCTYGHILDLNSTINKKRDLIHHLMREFKEYADLIEFKNV